MMDILLRMILNNDNVIIKIFFKKNIKKYTTDNKKYSHFSFCNVC